MPVSPKSTFSGSLFGDDVEEELDIPSVFSGSLFGDEEPTEPYNTRADNTLKPSNTIAETMDAPTVAPTVVPPVAPFSNPIDLFSNIIEQTQPQEAPQGPPALAPTFSPSVAHEGRTEEPQEAIDEFVPGIYEDGVLLEGEGLTSLDIDPYDPTVQDLQNEDLKTDANTLSHNQEREGDLALMTDQGTSELAKTPRKFAFINSIFDESQGIRGERQRDMEFVQRRRETYASTAMAAYESSDRERTPNEILTDLTEDPWWKNSFTDQNELDKEEYGFAVLEDEMIKAQLPASVRVELHDMLRQKYDKNQQTFLERLMYDTTIIPFGESASGDMVRLAGGASNAVGGALYMTLGTISLPFTSEKYSIRGEEAMSPIENFVLGNPDVNRLINWNLSGQETEFYPDDIFASMVHGGEIPSVLDPFFSQAIYTSLRGDSLSTAIDLETEWDVSPVNIMMDVAGSFSIPVYSPSEVIHTTNRIGNNKEEIIDNISRKLIEKESKGSTDDFLSIDDPTRDGWAEDMYSIDQADIRERAEKIFSRLSGVNFFGRDAVNELSEENQEYAKMFLEYFPERTSTVGFKSFEVIDKAAAFLFETEASDNAFSYRVLTNAKKVTYGKYVKELLTAIPEENREAFLEVMSPLALGKKSKAFQEYMAPFTGDVLAIDAMKKQAFQEVAALYISMKEAEQIRGMARIGEFGKEWQITGRTKQEQDMYYSLVPTMLVMEQLIRTPEFSSSADAFLTTLSGSMEETPYQMALSVGAVWNTMFSDGEYKIGTEQFQENAAHKLEHDTFYVVADFAAFTYGLSKLAKSATINLAAMKDTMANLVNKGDAPLLETVQSIGSEFNQNRITIGDDIRRVSERPPVDSASGRINLGLEENVLPEINASVIAPDNTTISYRREIKVLEDKLKDKTLDGPTRDSYSTQLIQNQRLLEVALADIEGALGWTESVESSSGAMKPRERMAPQGGSSQTKRVESAWESSITPRQYEGIKGKTATQRKGILTEQIETSLNTLDEAYKSDPVAMGNNSKKAKEVLSRVAKEYGILDYNSPTGTRKIIKALKVMLIDDPIIWKELFTNSKAFQTVPSNLVTAKYAANVRGAKIKAGIKSRYDAARAIDEKGPIQILSEETKKSPREVKNRRDAIAIAEKLAESAAEPWQFLGLGLEDKIIAEFLQKSANAQKKAVILQKTTDMVGRRHDVVVFEQDGVVGTASPGDAAAYSKSPMQTSGPSPTETGWGRAGRVGMQRGLGDRGMNLINEYRATGKKRYGLAAMTEALSRPFAALNIPAWYRSAASEVVLHAWANGWTDVGGANSSWFKRLALSTGSMLAKPSLLLGAESQLLLAEHNGKIFEKKAAIDKDFDPNLKGFTATNERVAEIFGDDARLAGDDIVYNQLDVHHNGWLLSNDLDGVILIDNRTSKKYRVSDIFEKTVDSKGKLILERERYQTSLNLLEDDYASTGSPKTLARIRSIEARVLEIDQVMQSKNTVVNVNELFPDMELLKAEFEAATSPIEKAIIKDKIDVLSSITAKEIGDSVSTPGYRPKKPVNTMDDFEKGLLVLYNDVIQPRSAKIFDLVTQWINGKNSTRIMFENNVGYNHIVAQKIIVDGEIRYKVVKTFPDTLDGDLAAAEFKKRADLRKEDLPDPTEGQERVVVQEKGRGSVEEVSDATGGIGTLVNVSDDFLVNRAYDGSFDAPRLPKVKSHFEVKGADFIKTVTHYLSSYYESAKLETHIRKMADDIINSGATDQMIQHQLQALAKQILSGTTGGLEILKKHGGDPALAVGEVISMTARQQESVFGGKLSQTEKFALETSYKKIFKSEHLLEILSDFNRSFFKQTTELIDGISTSELHHKLRNDGFLVTKDEYVRLSPKVQNQYIKASDVTSGTRSSKIPVFTSELRGAYIHRKYADTFLRQQRMQEAQGIAMQSDSNWMNTIRAAGNATSRATKLNLLIDFFNNSMLKNAYGAQFTQSIAHGERILDPRYVVKVRKYMNDLSEGKVPSNPVLDRIIREHADGQTSIKSDFYSTKLGDAWKNLLLDFNAHSASRKVVSNMEALGSENATVAVKNLADTLSLKNFFKGGEFFEILKTQNIDGPTPASTKFGRGASWTYDKLGISRQWLLNAYGRPDFYYKVGYQWMLEEKHGYAPARAHKGALDTYIDYSDMSELVNFFRFGMGNPFSAEYLSEFVGFASNQVPAHFTLMTERPVRSFLLGQMARSYDAAINNTLKFGYTIQEMRGLLRDPTYNFLPFYTDAQPAIGSEHTGKPFYTGPAGFSAEEYTGTPGGFFLGETLGSVPLIPTGQKGLNFNMPLDEKNVTWNDFLTQFGNMSRAVGGMGNTASEAAKARVSVREREVAAEEPTSFAPPVVGEVTGEGFSDILGNVIEGTPPREQSRTYFSSILGRIIPPRIFKSGSKLLAAYLERPVFGQREYPITAYTKVAGLGIRPTDVGNISLPGLQAKEQIDTFNKRLDKLDADAIEAKGNSEEFDWTEYEAINDELGKMEETLAKRQDALSQAQIQNIDKLKAQVYVRVLQGLSTEEEYTEFLKSYDE